MQCRRCPYRIDYLGVFAPLRELINMQPIKLLHTADIHIGMENYGRIDPATGSTRVSWTSCAG